MRATRYSVKQTDFAVPLVRIVQASGYLFLHRTARDSSGMRLRSAQWHEYALPRQKPIGNLRSRDNLFTRDTLDGVNGVCIIEVPLYTHCTMYSMQPVQRHEGMYRDIRNMYLHVALSSCTHYITRWGKTIL